MNAVIDSPTDADVSGDAVNILIVDDEPKNLTVLESVLDDPGYRLIRANSGDQALLALMAHEFAVLVLDVRMPGMTGFELAAIVKERKKTARIPIIFLTAYYNEDQHMMEGYGSGAVDYLHKPVNPGVLRSKVAVFAELHRKERALHAANHALAELNASLDRRVHERTEALKASEDALRISNQRKDEFLATLAHELRNPLAPIRNAVQILRLKGLVAPEQQWGFGIIDRQVKSMARLIDDLMDVSRINQGKLDLRLERVELGKILEEAVETARPLIDECGHTLYVSVPDEPAPLYADATRLAQAFLNLLNNASKYSDRNGRIELVAVPRADRVEVTVRDSGIGIAPERLDSIFEMFSQVESALARSRGGLGVGLSLARRLIEMHGGSIHAQSAGLGHGSCFIVELPLAVQRDLADDPAAPQQQFVEVAQGSERRVLVADDNVDAAATLAMLLQTLGYAVREVHDGQAAVEAAAEFKPQLAFLDIGMPGLNGYQACKQIRALPGGADMRLVAVTGWGQEDDRSAAREAGFDTHLVKPVEPGDLAAVLGSAASAPN
ncbi:response regulator [Ramlibacter sp. XY19]|uniref:response regulator n=1 Tax=Ramlibacter paludis TaxID=2908000 RepID=UPI0023DC2524|nr:response regulator [Ramlibacter paludis]MCG2593118.1 response regulator [Ramlibacter paludis]